MHNTDYILDNDTHNLPWDFEMLISHLISARRPDYNNQKQKTKKENLSRLTKE